MAAEVKPPRIVRETTNMERAALAAVARAEVAEPRNIDLENVYSDLCTATTFIIGLENFICELQALGPDGGKLAIEMLGHADTMAFEVKRIVSSIRGELSDFIDAVPANQLRAVAKS